MLRLIICALLFSLPHFAKAETPAKPHPTAHCAIYVESEPNVYDKELVRTPGPVVGLDESIFFLVSADRTKVSAMTRNEYERRYEQNDFKDFDHGTLVSFQQAYEDGYDVSMTLIEASQPFKEMIYVEALGALTNDHGLGLLVGQRRIYGLCSTRKSTP